MHRTPNRTATRRPKPKPTPPRRAFLSRFRPWTAQHSLGALALAGGVPVLGMGLNERNDIALLADRGVVTEGVVVDVKNGKYLRLVVSYTTADGTFVTEDTSNVVNVPEVGDSIEVVYDPQDPYRMQAKDWGEDYGGPAIELIGGLALVGYGTYRLLRRRR